MTLNRNTAPAPNGTISFQLPEIKRIELDNGLPVMFVQKENLPIVQISIAISAGSKYEAPEKKGLAYLTTALIDEGAGKYSALELDDEIEKLGSVLSTSVDHDMALISMMTLKENFERSLELLSLVVSQPKLDESDFDREKKKLLTKIIQLNDDPSYIANSLFEKQIYNNTPYSLPTIGNEDTVTNVTLNDIKKYYEKYYLPSNSYLVVVGNISGEDLTSKLNTYFASWNKAGEIQDVSAQMNKVPSKLYIVHRDNSAQCEIRIGHVCEGRNNPDFYARSLMNTILGGQFSSRINLNLREDKGYTYGANSSFSYKKGIGHFYVSTAVQNENAVSSVKEILKELTGIKEGIKQEEVDFAKSYQVKSFPSMFETYSQIARNLTHLIIHSLPDNYFNTYIDKIEAQTLKEIFSAAKNHIDLDNFVILLVGDKNVLSAKLQEETGLEPIELNIKGDPV